MATFIIHIGAPRTATTTLQKHIFPYCKNKMVFSKIPFNSSGTVTNRKKSIGQWNSYSTLAYINSISKMKEIDHYDFANQVLFPSASCLAHDPTKSISPKRWYPVMKSAINFLLERSAIEKKDIFISSERLCDTAASFICQSRHEEFSCKFPIIPFCESINEFTKSECLVLVTLREPLSYLRSKYSRTVIQRRLTGARFLTPHEYIQKQSNLEINNPGTSAITPAMHLTFIKLLMNYSFVKAIGFRELTCSKDIFSLLGLNGESKYSFQKLPKENKLASSPLEINEIDDQIKSSLKQNGFYNRILNEQLFD